MRLRLALAVTAVAVGCGAAGPEQPVTAVLTGGSGMLTKCYSWFVSPTCNTYHHITVPRHIAVGDMLPITYGSNPKYFAFPALRISVQGDRCTIFSEQQNGSDRADTLIVVPCKAATR